MYRSTDAVEVIGCSYRQLHYLTACGITPAVVTGPGGSGSRYHWSRAQVIRLTLAFHLAQVVPDGSFPELAPACLNVVGEPPRSGYAMYTTGPTEAAWAGTWADVRMILERWGSCAIARYDLADLIGDRLDTADLVHA